MAAALALLLVAFLDGGLPGPTTGSAGASSPAGLSLTEQTPWVTSSSGVRLTLQVRSPLPASRLGLNVVLYSRLGSRDALLETFGGTEPTTEYPLDTPATIPLAGHAHHGLVTLHLPVTAGYRPESGHLDSPTLALDCASGGVCSGIYPLELVLIDRTDGTPLASLTTYLVNAPPAPGSLPLEVSLVLPVGDRPALSPSGTPALRPSRLKGLSGLLHVLEGAPHSPVSLAVHGQLVDALAGRGGSARGILSELRGLVGPDGNELLPAPYASPSPDALAADHLGSELGRQLAAGRKSLAAHLDARPSAGPYLVTDHLDPAGLALLTQQGIHSVILPPTSLASPTTPVSTTTAPLLIGPPRGRASGTTPAAGIVPPGTTEAALSDPGLAATFDAASAGPVLAAQRFLAELASVYFDDPFATQPRGVVVAPSTTGSSSAFLAQVLAGLASSPILRPVTASTFLDTVPVGANRTAATGTLAPHHGDLASVPAVVMARRALATVRSVVPTDQDLAAQLDRAILLGESLGLDRSAQAAYEDAPYRALRTISRDLSLSEARTTLTSRSGRIPVTVASSLGYPVHVLLRLHSSDLTFAANRSVLQLRLDLTGKASQSDIRVSTRTSGSSRLDIALVSPRGDYVLLEDAVAVRSTAISGVAVALSLGALLVLFVWWVRSSRRRRAIRAGGDSPGGGGRGGRHRARSGGGSSSGAGTGAGVPVATGP